MERCPLCRREGRPTTREHIFARWLVRQVHGGKLLPSEAPIAAVVPTRIARVTADVCADCNAGWMSSLEVSFRRLLFGRARSGTIQAPDRVTLSRWFTKTAVLLADAHGAPLVDEADRARLVAGMPEAVEVLIARRRRPRQRLDYTIDAARAEDAARARAVAIFLDDLVAHVAPRGTLTSARGTRLWPLRTHALRWETIPVRSAREREEIRGV